MTMPITIGLLLVFVASVQPLPMPTQAILPSLNAVRRQVANKMGVSAPDLVWDEGLVAQIQYMSGSCKGWVNTVEHRYAPFDPDRNGDKLEKFTWATLSQMSLAYENPDLFPHISKEHLELVQKEIERKLNTNEGTFGVAEFFNPLQRRVGCAKKYCEGVIPDVLFKLLEGPLQLEGYMHAYYSVCLLGPSGTWDIAMLNQIKSQPSLMLVTGKKEAEEKEEMPQKGLPPPPAVQKPMAQQGTGQQEMPPPVAREQPKAQQDMRSTTGSSASIWSIALISLLYLSLL